MFFFFIVASSQIPSLEAYSDHYKSVSYPKNSDRDLAEKEGHEVQLKKRKENDPKGEGDNNKTPGTYMTWLMLQSTKIPRVIFKSVDFTVTDLNSNSDFTIS